MTNCPYCHTSNGTDEHRCQRCGRRMDSSNPYSRQPYGRTATAPALQYEAESEAQSTALAEPPAKRSAPFQASLFQNRVVSFESFAPESVETRPKVKTAARTKAKRELPGQESFRFETFETVITQPAPQNKAAEPVIGCSACVAVPAHRIIAAAFDLSVVVISMALFLVVFYLLGGQMIFNAYSAALGVGITTFFYVLYELLWCMADTDTAGMRWAHLKLVNFDGAPPEREQRMVRIASGGLSMLAAGLGILWALVDEEALTWHDHISKTFPTPY